MQQSRLRLTGLLLYLDRVNLFINWHDSFASRHIPTLEQTCLSYLSDHRQSVIHLLIDHNTRSYPRFCVGLQGTSHRLAYFSVPGVPKAINWAVFPDWYNLSVHWQGYIPTEALNHDWWHSLAEYVVPVGKEYGVAAKVAEWCLNRIRHLR